MSRERFRVTIIEMLQLTVDVDAESKQEAEHIVSEDWMNSEYILDDENFTGVKFNAVPLSDIPASYDRFSILDTEEIDDQEGEAL